MHQNISKKDQELLSQIKKTINAQKQLRALQKEPEFGSPSYERKDTSGKASDAQDTIKRLQRMLEAKDHEIEELEKQIERIERKDNITQELELMGPYTEQQKTKSVQPRRPTFSGKRTGQSRDLSSRGALNPIDSKKRVDYQTAFSQEAIDKLTFELPFSRKTLAPITVKPGATGAPAQKEKATSKTAVKKKGTNASEVTDPVLMKKFRNNPYMQ